MLAVALEASGTTLARLRVAVAFTVGPLPADAAGRSLAQRVGRRGIEAPDKSAGLVVTRAPITGAPIVAGALGWLECRVHALHRAGDHEVAMGEIVGAGLAEGIAPVETPAPLAPLMAAATGWRYGV